MASCTYSVPNLDASGDNLYGPRICWQAFIDWAWDAFDFDEGDWDEGFGYDDVCNNTKPLSRAMSGIHCLTYSSPRFPNESYSGTFWNGDWFVRNAIDESMLAAAPLRALRHPVPAPSRTHNGVRASMI
jgi:hypothetical protein